MKQCCSHTERQLQQMTSFSVNQIILTYGWEKMPRNQVTKDELVVRVLKLKNKVDQEPSTVWQGEKDLAHKYLNEVLYILDEYRM